MLNTKLVFWLLTSLLIVTLALTACNSGTQQAVDEALAAEEHNDADEHADEAGHNDADEHADEAGHNEDSHASEDHMAGAHDVPEDAAAVPNPIMANESSLAAGETTFTTNCAVCHGEKGYGDGPGAAGMEKQPANLTAGHVQGLSDGALFYIISHGKSDTPMPAWENILDKDQRWQVVNFLRTLE